MIQLLRLCSSGRYRDDQRFEQQKLAKAPIFNEGRDWRVVNNGTIPAKVGFIWSSGANYVKHCDVRKVLTAVTCLVLMAEQADIDVGNVIIH